LAYRCCEQRVGVLRPAPRSHKRFRGDAHHDGENIRVGHEHSVERRGSRAGVLGGSSSSTPPKAAKRAWTRSYRLSPGGGPALSVCCRIRRTSASIEWPCSAARTRRRAFNAGSRLRMVILLTPQPPSAPASMISLIINLCSLSPSHVALRPARKPRISLRFMAAYGLMRTISTT
jgi:hypothetical protein